VVVRSDESAAARLWPDLRHRIATGWRSFREWRRCRPFWGGLLLLLSGLELLAIPLSSVLTRGLIKLVIYIGIGGVAGVIIGALLMACGVLVWFQPAHRAFYSIAGVLLAVASFIATNLGGFFVGMLIGVVGGSVSFAWTPISGEPECDQADGKTTRLAWMAPVLALSLALPAHGAGGRTAHPQPSCILPIPILCPSPSLPPVPLPSPTLSLPIPLPGAPTPATPSHKPSKGRKASAMKAAAPLQVTSAQFSLVTGVALLKGSAYQGVAHVAVAGGGTVDMMKFSMNSLILTGGPTLTVREKGGTSSAAGASMQFTGNVVLYATKLSGDLAGVPITLTPNSPLPLVLQLLGSVTQRVQLQLTNVTTNQPYISTDTLIISALHTSTPG
jgi:hypothetical protein